MVDINEFYKFIDCAMSNIANDYWMVQTAEGDEKVRERVFCYELYHQMRLLQELPKYGFPQMSELTIAGELLKRGFVGFKSEDGNTDEQKCPDFIFHVPKEHENNAIVMEVKGRTNSNSYKQGIYNDFKTINAFIKSRKLYYQAGVFLLYGHTQQEAIRVIRSITFDFKFVAPDKIYIITKERNREEMKVKKLSEIFSEEH